MNTTPVTRALLLSGALLNNPTHLLAHEHLNTGATGQHQGDQLIFANGEEFSAASGTVIQMTPAADGSYGGQYAAEITFTVLAATSDFGGPVPGAPALGSYIQARIESVQGPAGGTFSFWNEGETIPGISMPSGTTIPSALWALSDEEDHIAAGLPPAGTPGADPWGHVHGTQFTADVPGDYTVGFRLFDTSNNGLNGGPIHTPSELFSIHFSAVPEPGMLSLAGLGMAVGLGIVRRRSNFPATRS